MEQIKLIPIENNKFTDSKTLVKAEGISYIVKKLIKDGKIQSKTYNEIIEGLEENLNTAS